MIEVWVPHQLEDFVRFRNGKSIKAGTDGRYPVYGSNGIIGQSDDFMYEDAIILGRVGAYCGSVERSFGRFWASDNTIVVEADSGTTDTQFVYYLLLDASLNRHAGGAAQPLLTQSRLKPLEFLLPPLHTQQRIAAILSAYDDLIETNTRRIAILEEMARRLYEEWFVHFRFPGHEGVEFDGELPREWSAVELDDLVQINPRTAVPRVSLKPFVPMGALSETSMVIEGIEQRDGNSGTKFQNADTLVARITPCLENGKTGFVDFLDENQPVAFGSTEFIVLRPLILGPCAIYCLARSHAFRDVAIKSMSGAEGRQRVRPESIQKYPIAQPPADLLDQFERIVSPMFSRVSLMARQNANLRAQRDLLLPKLVSGEIDVSGAEAALQAAE
ncbi:restriction endonuclease subunit S [Tropicimonas sp. IMCC34011]|uniref:restriction endonuclease subunit S n=1 Tax=Tropicimonas sp. IMCC34011 TaxID=2248759 RepID=UPI000E2567C6|nr:restriction endonuclease subunit S [Tropicimonas sp. IMCC34011]